MNHPQKFHKLLKNNNTKSSGTVFTNDKVIIETGTETKTLIVVQYGDTNGDGVADLKDILQINKHRLNKSLLINEFIIAGDVNFDNAVDLKDLLQINKFRLGKINTL